MADPEALVTQWREGLDLASKETLVNALEAALRERDEAQAACRDLVRWHLPLCLAAARKGAGE